MATTNGLQSVERSDLQFALAVCSFLPWTMTNQTMTSLVAACTTFISHLHCWFSRPLNGIVFRLICANLWKMTPPHAALTPPQEVNKPNVASIPSVWSVSGEAWSVGYIGQAALSWRMFRRPSSSFLTTIEEHSMDIKHLEQASQKLQEDV